MPPQPHERRTEPYGDSRQHIDQRPVKARGCVQGLLTLGGHANCVVIRPEERNSTAWRATRSVRGHPVVRGSALLERFGNRLQPCCCTQTRWPDRRGSTIGFPSHESQPLITVQELSAARAAGRLAGQRSAA